MTLEVNYNQVWTEAGNHADYADSKCGSLYPDETYWGTVIRRITITNSPASSSILTLTWSCTLNEAHDNEWYGIRGLEITTRNCSVTNCWTCGSRPSNPCTKCFDSYFVNITTNTCNSYAFVHHSTLKLSFTITIRV